jgi:hypothetical protein
MKRLALLAVLLSVSTFLSADNIKLTSGSGQIYPMGVPYLGFTFQFHGSGYDLFPGFLDNFSGQLVTCIPCDPTTLFGFPLFLAGGPFTTGNPYLDGIIQFDAVSFVSSLAPSGILTVKYTATAYLYLLLVDPVTSAQIGPFVWGSPDPWIITAQFRPDVGLPGIYEFTGATLISTPEPTTLLLLGTGLAVIGWRKYKATAS